MKTKISFILLAIIGFISCDEYLDTVPKDRVTPPVVWESKQNTILYVNTFYAYLDRYGQFGNAQFSGSLTEGLTETLKYGSYVPGAGDANMYVFTPEVISPSGSLLGTWDASYERIRRINEFLVDKKLYGNFDKETDELFEAQARFFRAFLYFELAKRHDGSVILYTDMNLVKDKDRAPANEVWDQIEADLDYAISILPIDWDAANKGRLTKGAVLGFKTRAMLYAKRWESSNKAADDLIALNKYSLMPNYSDAWKGNNAESILEYNYLLTGPNHNFDLTFSVFGEVENQGAMATPTQEMVESYEKKDGTKVDWSPWRVAGGTTVRPPYADLEPRFHATIIYNGSTWKGKVMQNSVGGTNGRYMAYREATYPQGRTTTGYYLRKLVDEKHTDLQTNKSTQPWVAIRLAEVYLNKAEALYRLNKTAEALSYVNKIRERVGLPQKQGLIGEDLFKAIRQERKVELSYEGLLYWDMLRWRLADKEYNNYRVHGFKITPAGSSDYNYEYVDCDLQDRKFLTRVYILPIPITELNNNSAIQQFEDWK